MEYTGRFVRQATAEHRTTGTSQETAPEVSDRTRKLQTLMDQVLALLHSKKGPPEEPYAYSLVRVKPRLPQLSAGATAELDR